jgi:hypothetical protein
MNTDSQNTKPSALDQIVLYRMTTMEDALRQLTEQVSKLVVIEERQSQTAASVDRAFSEIRLQDARIKALELAQPVTERTNVWVERALLAAAGAAVSLLWLAKFGAH